MDEKADARHDQQHDAGQRVDQKREVDGEGVPEDPPVRDDFTYGAGAERVDEDPDRTEEGEPDGAPGKPMGGFMRVPMSRQAVQHHGHERRDGNQ